ncbi:hypothetical protein F4604DRAFT_1937842 [Suillus subluteus]|nr:hypothetical protein F4604DRAFT_1937842 [Suillus subluteus]
MLLLHRALLLKQIHEDDPDSVTEPESEPDVPPKPIQPVQPAQPLENNPDSVMEPESELDVPPNPVQPIQPLKNDPDSVTEPESSDIDIPSSTLTATLKRKSFFATPSPPPPNSIYWKYVSRERGCEMMKQELEQL